MIITEWILAICSIISVPISIWAVIATKNNTRYIKKIELKIGGGITMNKNVLNGPGTLLHIGDKK